MKKIFLAALATGLATIAIPANAAITIGYSTDGGATKTTIATDGGTGSAGFSGTLDGFLSTISSFGSPAVAQPSLLTNSLNVTSNGGTTSPLLIYITQSGLSSFNGGLLSSFTSNLLTGSALNVTESTWIDPANGLFSGSLMATQMFSAIGSNAIGTTVNQSGPFSETAVYSLNFGEGAGTFNDTINISAVPEPSTWGMMLLGFLGMGVVLRRRKLPIAQMA